MKIIKSISEASEYCSHIKNKVKTIATINTGEDLIEGVKINLWLERFWMFLENKNLML